MERWLVIAGFGLLAQLVDGALGMGYGATSTTLLLAAGLTPAVASASVHLAQVGTTLTAGLAHWRFGNVDWPMVMRLGIPGGVGALGGATLLSSLSTDAARPVMATLLAGIGAWLLVRFTMRPPSHATVPSHHGLRSRFLVPLGVVAGVVDATGGGGWGPLATPSLLVTERVEPRRVIGTVDTSEFLVTASASVGFLVGLGRDGFSAPAVLALLAGGLVAAPLAAFLVTRIPPSLLGASVGGVLLLTNAHTVVTGLGVARGVVMAVNVVLVAAWGVALVVAYRRRRRPRPLLRRHAARDFHHLNQLVDDDGPDASPGSGSSGSGSSGSGVA